MVIFRERIYLAIKHYHFKNINLFYLESDSGEPLLLIHGVCTSTKSFNNIIPDLSTRYHVFALDLRGHGESDRTPNEYFLSNFTKDVVAFFNDVIKKHVHIYGDSLGGILAVMLNEFIPEKIRSIVIGDSPILLSYIKENRDFWALWSEATQSSLGSQLSVEQFTNKLSNTDLIINNTKIKLGELYSKEILYFFAYEYKTTDPEINKVYTDFDGFTEKYDVNKYKTITCPVHLIQADQKFSNLLSYNQISEKKEKYIPQPTHITLNGYDHNLQIIKKDEILRILLNYFDLQ